MKPSQNVSCQIDSIICSHNLIKKIHMNIILYSWKSPFLDLQQHLPDTLKVWSLKSEATLLFRKFVNSVNFNSKNPIFKKGKTYHILYTPSLYYSHNKITLINNTLSSKSSKKLKRKRLISNHLFSLTMPMNLTENKMIMVMRIWKRTLMLEQYSKLCFLTFHLIIIITRMTISSSININPIISRLNRSLKLHKSFNPLLNMRILSFRWHCRLSLYTTILNFSSKRRGRGWRWWCWVFLLLQ